MVLVEDKKNNAEKSYVCMQTCVLKEDIFSRSYS